MNSYQQGVNPNSTPATENPQLQYPWAVRVVISFVESGQRYHSIGGGVVINSRWVLTVEHVAHFLPQHHCPDEDLTIQVYSERDPNGMPIPANSYLSDNVVGVVECEEAADMDIMALHLERDLHLLEYAPLNRFYQPRLRTDPDPHGVSLVEPEQIQGFGFGPEASSVNPLVSSNRFHRFAATTETVRPDPLLGGREIFASINPGEGATTMGDSGGPIMIDGQVVGLLTGGAPDVPVPTYVAFTPLGDTGDFLDRLLPEAASTSLVTTGALLSVVWNSAHGAGCGWHSTLGDNFVDCDLSGWRVFYQPVKDGPSWSGALSKDVGADERKAEIPRLPKYQRDVLWRATVVPLIKGKPQRVGADGVPAATTAGSFVGSATAEYTMPTNLKVIPEDSTGQGYVRVSWDAAQGVPDVPAAAGYRVFFRGKTASDSWSSWSNAPDTDKTEAVIPVTKSTSKGPWQVVVLPFYNAPQIKQTVLIGADKGGLPFETDATERGKLVDKPVLMGQFPDPGKTTYVTIGTVGEVSVMGVFTNVEPAAKVGSLQWEWSASQKGPFSSAGDWSRLQGQNSAQLVFGTPDHPAATKDSGWYRLKATNSLGTTTTGVVRVDISDKVLPKVLDQSPAPYSKVVGYTDSVGDAEVEVLFTANPAPSKAAVVWEKLDPKTGRYTPNLSKAAQASPLQSFGTAKDHQYIASLIFGDGNTYPTKDDSGWYIIYITTQFSDGSTHEAYSLPVFVSIGAPIN
ncbi:hypothetical protein Xmir_02520 [Xenorhabdus miraniensis]|uniref:Peptidase S1 domain-containing protein n=2 Tax=Xenorhabdus miraniensis TaxID=351674 RepID=A0A2D0JPD1_9GAMM|nr:hypothetical protein Xmir_02520 [Xenorhabdus miraniensis]